MRAVGRRRVLAGVLGASVVGAAGGGLGWWYRSRPASIPLYSSTVAFAAPGERVLVDPQGDAAVLAGSRVLEAAAQRDVLVDQERAWLAGLAPWTRASAWWSGLLREALLDLRVLTDGLPAPVAGWSPLWRYVWPRDSAHVAVALALVGRQADAERTLRFLQRVQRPDGGFAARYLMDGSGTPDDRPPQMDGVGWALWAAARSAVEPDLVAGLVVRSTERVLAETADGTRLPRPSPDYWEIHEDELTLGTAAPLASGLSLAGPLLRRLRRADLGERAEAAAPMLRRQIDVGFGPRGYPRYPSDREQDAAISFLLPPYTDEADQRVAAVQAASLASMRRPAGGLAPGAGWRQDGVSWTPETALAALTLAHTGRTELAETYLRWLSAHRTAAGSLPEKVLHDGRPAAVAPLAWTAALVVLTVDALRAQHAGSRT
ncbi:MAG: glycoside hydrolase family 15 [Angustibacter sp.]